MTICLAGEGALGKKHLAGLRKIDGVEDTLPVGGVANETLDRIEKALNN